MTDVHGIAVAGGTFPAQIWHDYMEKATDGTPDRGFPAPRGTPDWLSYYRGQYQCAGYSNSSTADSSSQTTTTTTTTDHHAGGHAAASISRRRLPSQQKTHAARLPTRRRRRARRRRPAHPSRLLTSPRPGRARPGAGDGAAHARAPRCSRGRTAPARAAARRPPPRRPRLVVGLPRARRGRAFAAYVAGSSLLRRRAAPLAAVAVIAAAMQLAPLAGPLLISTRCLDLLGVRPPRRRARRESVPGGSRGRAPRPRGALGRDVWRRTLVDLRARVHACLRAGRPRCRHIARTCRMAVQGARGARDAAGDTRGDAGRAERRLRLRVRRLEPVSWPCTRRAVGTTTPGWRRWSLGRSPSRPPAGASWPGPPGRRRSSSSGCRCCSCRSARSRRVTRGAASGTSASPAPSRRSPSLATWRYGTGWLHALEPVVRKAGERDELRRPVPAGGARRAAPSRRRRARARLRRGLRVACRARRRADAPGWGSRRRCSC